MSSRFNLGQAYLYLVSLIMLIISVVSFSSLVRTVVSVAYPDPYVGSMVYCQKDAAIAAEKAGMPAVPVTSPEVSSVDCEKQAELEKQSRDRNTVLDLIGEATLLGISVPMYLYHWRRVSQERKEDRLAAGSERDE